MKPPPSGTPETVFSPRCPAGPRGLFEDAHPIPGVDRESGESKSESRCDIGEVMGDNGHNEIRVVVGTLRFLFEETNERSWTRGFPRGPVRQRHETATTHLKTLVQPRFHPREPLVIRT